MEYNRRMSESLAVLASLKPQSLGAGATNVGPFNLKQVRKALVVLHVGALGVSGTVDLKLQASATSGGTYADVPGAAITQITAGSENVVELEISVETLMNNDLGPYVKAVITIGTAASQVSLIVYGGVSRYEPASDQNEAAVTQTVIA